MNTITIGLCQGRHDIPNVEDYIFDTILNPFDQDALTRDVHQALAGADQVTLYVTGLTIALGAVVAYCSTHQISLTLMHYNRDTNAYVPQVVLK